MANLDKMTKMLRRRSILIFIILLLSTNVVYSAPHYPTGNISGYITDVKNNIKNDNWFNNIDNTETLYLKSIIDFFYNKSEPSTSFRNTFDKVKNFDRGDLILGLFSSNNNKQWVITKEPRYATYSDYKAFVDKIIDKISTAKLMFTQNQMDGKAYFLKYNLGVVAGMSSAWNPRPDAQLQHKVMDSEMSLRYAFKTNQQGLRHALLTHYINELYEQKKETAGFIQFTNALCSPTSSIYRDYNSANFIETSPPDQIRGYCSGVLYYQPVTKTLRNLALFLFEMDQRELTVLCAQASLISWQNNLITTTNELLLFQLSSMYNLLQHFEK